MRTSLGILALRDGGEHEPVGKLRGKILQTVDGEVRAAVEERLVDLLREDALAYDDGVQLARAGRPSS